MKRINKRRFLEEYEDENIPGAVADMLISQGLLPRRCQHQAESGRTFSDNLTFTLTKQETKAILDNIEDAIDEKWFKKFGLVDKNDRVKFKFDTFVEMLGEADILMDFRNYRSDPTVNPGQYKLVVTWGNAKEI